MSKMDIRPNPGNLEDTEKILTVDDEENKLDILIPISFENWKGKSIKQYRIDQITPIKKKHTGKSWLKKLRRDDNQGIPNFRTPDEVGEKADPPPEKELKTTTILKPIVPIDKNETLSQSLKCITSIDINNEQHKKLKKHKEYKVNLALISDDGAEIKREVIVNEKDKTTPIRIRKKGENLLFTINFFLFLLTASWLFAWNNVLNPDAYGYNGFWTLVFKQSVLNLFIGAFTAYIGISAIYLLIKLISSLFKPKGVLIPGIRCSFNYPEMSFKNTFVSKLKTKSSLALILTVIVLAIPLYIFSRSFELPPLPDSIEGLSYYDSEKGVEIKSPRIYKTAVSTVKIAVNDKYSRSRSPLHPFYVGELEFDRNNNLIIKYKNFNIENIDTDSKTSLPFEDIVYGKELKKIKRNVRDIILGKEKKENDNVIEWHPSEGTFTVTRYQFWSLDELKDELTNFSQNFDITKFDPKTSCIDKDETLRSYKDEFIKSSGSTKIVRAKELLELYLYYTDSTDSKRLDSSFANDTRKLAMLYCQFNASTDFNIRFTPGQIKQILGAFEDYYTGTVKNIRDVDGRITQLFLRLLLFIEKNFTEDSRPDFHDSIAGVLEGKGKGGEYYLYYLAECARNNVLFSAASEDEESERILFFKSKKDTINLLTGARNKLKGILSISPRDKRLQKFAAELSKPSAPPEMISKTSPPDGENSI
jgi:hypothetical protein